MSKVYSLCPISIGFIFKPCINNDPFKTGSVGIGCTLDQGVKLEVETNNRNSIFYNNIALDLPPVATVIERLAKEKVSVKIVSPLPLGFGFGISGASTLGVCFALNKLFSLNKKREELIKIAHVAEIENHTGLGTVGTQSIGGFLIKDTAGFPFKFRRLPFIGQKLYAIIIDKLITPSILTDKKRLKMISRAANLTLAKIKRKRSLRMPDIIDLSYDFATSAQLLTDKRVISVIEKIKKNGGHATMAMLGKVVISDVRPKLNNYRIEGLTITEDSVSTI